MNWPLVKDSWDRQTGLALQAKMEEQHQGISLVREDPSGDAT